jgi:hypothetical protein
LLFLTLLFKITGNKKMTPSLGNFIASLVAGALIALAIGWVLVLISKTDRVTRV